MSSSCSLMLTISFITFMSRKLESQNSSLCSAFTNESYISMYDTKSPYLLRNEWCAFLASISMPWGSRNGLLVERNVTAIMVSSITSGYFIIASTSMRESRGRRG